jgi:hypothetical protein
MDFITILIVIGLILLIPTAYAAKIGAPYAPTFSAAINQAFDYIKLSQEDTLVDLGAGDGRLLIQAHRRGAKAIGYELSPIMWLITWLRLILLPLSKNVKRGTPAPKIYLRNFYKQKLPPSTTVVFAFLMPEHMNRVKEYLAAQDLPHAKYMLVYAFPFKDVKPINIIKAPNCSAVHVYDFKELVNKTSN